MGESNYNALQVKATQRLSKGVDFLVAYTLSKTITTVDDAFGWGGAGSTDTKKLSLERALAPNSNNPGDRTHNLAVAFGYELPFARYVTSSVAKHIVGGWKVAGILNYSSGSALGIGYPNNLGDVIFNNGGRYNIVQGQSLRNNVGERLAGDRLDVQPKCVRRAGGVQRRQRGAHLRRCPRLPLPQ